MMIKRLFSRLYIHCNPGQIPDRLEFNDNNLIIKITVFYIIEIIAANTTSNIEHIKIEALEVVEAEVEDLVEVLVPVVEVEVEVAVALAV